MDEPWTHYFRVTMRIEGIEDASRGGPLRLAMPVWTPGSYLVREFARNVLDLRVTDAAGRELRAEKEAKDRWLVSAPMSESVDVTYRVYAFRHDTSESYLDSDHAVINGASVFLYPIGYEASPITLEVVPYPSWKVVSTGLPRSGGEGRRFEATDYDVLVDSPIEVGNQHVTAFEVQGVPHEVSIYAPNPVDESRLVSDIRTIVESTVPVFGEVPYNRYLFLVDFTDQGAGGLEHLNSTYCIASYLGMASPPEYRRMLSLFSHEFFHAWNVKRMRPTALGPFDYSRENYTRSLWISEGLTSYYGAHILRRADVVTVPEFLEMICDEIAPVKSLPSARAQSPQESSFDTWIKLYREDENSPNVSPSYYRQGASLGVLLDLEIRRSSSLERTLDDAMRDVYRSTYKEGRGFTDAEFEDACSRVSAGATEEIFARYVRDPGEIDFARYLGYAGLTLEPKSSPDSPEGFLGVRVRPGQGLVIQSRLSGSPAETADLSAGDEIIALDGLRMDGQRLPYYVASRPPGAEVSVTFSREGTLRETRARLSARPPFEFRVQKKSEATEQEKAAFRSWTMGSWEEPLTYKERRASPAIAKRLEYV